MDATTKMVWLRTVCMQNGLNLSEGQLAQFEAFAAHLLAWNQKINLISRRDEENFWRNHILHSLSPLFKVEIARGSQVLDLGTGGGLPGIPLRIARPDLTFTLLDSTQKKINVVKDIINTLGLDGVTAVWGRGEHVGKTIEHNHRYDIVFARAVASLKDLLRWSEPFLKTNGTRVSTTTATNEEVKKQIIAPTLVALKGGDLEGEIGQIRKLTQVKNITVLNLMLKGSSQLEGGDKKVVLVEIGRTQKQKAENH